VTSPQDFLKWLELFEATYPEIKIKRPTSTRHTWEAAGTGFELTIYPSHIDLWTDLSGRYPLEDLALALIPAPRESRDLPVLAPRRAGERPRYCGILSRDRRYRPTWDVKIPGARGFLIGFPSRDDTGTTQVPAPHIPFQQGLS
jgi:hypothetical protein